MPNRSNARGGFASGKSLDIAVESLSGDSREGANVQIAPDLAARACEAARRIHSQIHCAIIQIGHELKAIKREMSHGMFTAWINAEMGGMTPRTAQNYMKIARWVEGKPKTGALLPPTIIYLLASPSTRRPS
jgi:hypothetical protein